MQIDIEKLRKTILAVDDSYCEAGGNFPINIDLPDNVLKEIEMAWGKNSERKAATLTEAKAKFDEITGYGLKIYWLGRIDKLNPNNVKVFQWITENFVPVETQQKQPVGSIWDVKFKDEDTNQLLKETLNKLWDNYTQIPNNGLPQDSVKKFSLKNLFRK